MKHGVSERDALVANRGERPHYGRSESEPSLRRRNRTASSLRHRKKRLFLDPQPISSLSSHAVLQGEPYSFKFIEMRDSSAVPRLKLWRKWFKNSVQFSPSAARTFFLFSLLVVAIVVDGLRPITLVWSKDPKTKTYPYSQTSWIVFVKFQVVVFSVLLYLISKRYEDSDDDEMVGVGEIVEEDAPTETTFGTSSFSPRIPHTRTHSLMAHHTHFAHDPTAENEMWRKFKLSLLLVPSVVFFLLSDLVSFGIFRHVSATTYSVVKQLRLVITALLFRFFLHREVTSIQWIAVVQLLLASVLFVAIDLLVSGGESVDGGSDDAYGIFLVLLKCVLDSFPGIWMDKYFKDLESQSNFPYVEQQVFFALWSFAIGVALAAYSDGLTLFLRPSSFFDGYNAGAYVSAVVTASYGMLVSLVLRYLDSMVKQIQALLSVVVTVYLDYYIFGTEIGIAKTATITLILTSVFLYKVGSPKKQSAESSDDEAPADQGAK